MVSDFIVLVGGLGLAIRRTWDVEVITGLYFENAIFIVISEGKASSKNASKATLQFQ
jgi:hypothetical protein